MIYLLEVQITLADPDPNPDQDPPDPHVFGPPGSGPRPINQRYGYGSRSFYHHAKIGKNLDSYYFVTLYDFEK